MGVESVVEGVAWDLSSEQLQVLQQFAIDWLCTQMKA